MRCDNCHSESPWLEVLGKEMVCHKCINKNKVMAKILKSHMDTFQFLVRKLKLQGYRDLLKVTLEDAEKVANLKKAGIVFKKR